MRTHHRRQRSQLIETLNNFVISRNTNVGVEKNRDFGIIKLIGRYNIPEGIVDG